MCGIGGLWHRDGKQASHQHLRRMMSAIRHRGPEGAAFGRMDAGAMLLGFLRLGFTGEGTCQQPLYNEDGSVALVYNGEIYDYAALRERLQSQGHVFRTQSDTEVIVHLYEQHGERFFEHLNGEFAFALWDARREELWLVRDRFGVKPLLYGWHRGAFAFASEAKALHALDGFEVALEPRYHLGPGMALAHGALTAFRGVHSVRPGHLLRVTRHGAREAPYWQPRFEGPAPSYGDGVHEVREALQRAVARRLDGQPPIALSLSSGIDSSVVCGLMADVERRAGRAVHAFGLGYDDAPYDESVAAARTAAHFGATFHRVPCTVAALGEGFLEATHSLEVATNNLSNAARVHLTRAVRAGGFKALMSGEGSDELFGGYPYFGVEAIWRARDAAALRRFREVERPSRGVFWDDGGASPASPLGYPSVYWRRAQKAQRSLGALFSRGWLAGLDGGDALALAADELDPRWLSTLTPFDATRVISRAILGSVVIPSLGDRVEMANSLEGRVPYLDFDVVQLAYRLPQDFCIEPGTFVRKRVLREAFAGALPPGFSPPPKHTAMAPTFRDLERTDVGRGLVSDFLSDAAVKRAGVFSRVFVASLRAARHLAPSLDPLVGWVVSTHALHAVHVDDALGKRRHLDRHLLPLDEDRTWTGREVAA